MLNDIAISCIYYGSGTRQLLTRWVGTHCAVFPSYPVAPVFVLDSIYPPFYLQMLEPASQPWEWYVQRPGRHDQSESYANSTRSEQQWK